MVATPNVALVMHRLPATRRDTAARLRDLGFAVSEFADEAHLWGRTMMSAAGEHRSFVMVVEPTEDVVHDLEVLRSGQWKTPLVLLGTEPGTSLARRLHAACVPGEHPTTSELCKAIERAVSAALTTRRYES
jgi:hypothetical protein